MSRISKKGMLTISLNGKYVSAPIEWQDLDVLATFDNENTQANITTTEITVVNDAAKIIAEWVSAGLSGGVGIFEGMPAKFTVYNQDNSSNIFVGYIDFTDNYTDSINFDGRVVVKLIKKDGLNLLSDRLEGLTYGYLESIGVFSNSDYITTEYIVEQEDNALELITISITLFIMIKELAEATRATAEAIADIAGITASGATGAIGAAIKAVAQAVIIIIYNAIILAAVIKLCNDLISMLIPPKRKHKTITLYKLISNVCEHLGYSFETDIADLAKFYNLPSNSNADEYAAGLIKIPRGTSSGIPSSRDTGYLCSEMFDTVKTMFNAKFAIINNTVQFRNVESEYWTKSSTYKMPSVLEKKKRYNTFDLIANRIISFATDYSDEYSVINFTGTNYEVITDAVSEVNPDAKLIKGLDVIKIPYALGVRKDKLTFVEESLKVLAGTVDGLTKAVGGNSNLKSKIKGRIGMLKVSNNNTALPKLLYLNSSGKLPANHRNFTRAKYFYDQYHTGKSFVQNDFYAQKLVYNNVRIPFGFNDFLSTTDNSYFIDDDGNRGKITKLEYNVSGDFANIDFWIRKKYSVNLKETFIEP